MDVVNLILLGGFLLVSGCSKKGNTQDNINPPAIVMIQLKSIQVDHIKWSDYVRGVSVKPDIDLEFSTAVAQDKAEENLTLRSKKDNAILPVNINISNEGKSVRVTPVSPLPHLSAFAFEIGQGIGENFGSSQQYLMNTSIDSSDKFPIISDEELLDKIQKQTFKYFWDFGHPVSGMARERNTSGDIVTTGGTGFGVMAIVTAIKRGFIGRDEGRQRIQKIVSFLKDKCTVYHGAFAHWVNGSTGETIPFSEKDNGGDLVETSLLMEGLLTARQFFDNKSSEESQLINDINYLWKNVEWSWYLNGQNVLYWHWSPEFGFQMNLKIQGWNESLITYLLAASSPTFPINREVYDNGWARNGQMKNGNEYYQTVLPLGPSLGGPLFFAHYSFLGLNPTNLSDRYADYWTQNKNHSLINKKYCQDNPGHYFGYSDVCWGLSASDDNQSGYMAHSPTNDDGVISPTAAVSSLPYLPEESMAAIRFFYYKLGDKIWGEYGFMDAFNLNDLWYSNSYLAIDQGPQIVMLENYRSGLLWDLFMSCREVKNGLDKLGFTYQ